MKRFKFIIAIGLLNFLHGLIHIFQFIQSVILAYNSFHSNNDNWFERVMESPWMGLLWVFLGIITLYIGYQDYKHHKKHKD